MVFIGRIREICFIIFYFFLCVRETGWEESEFWKSNVMGLMEVGERGEINSYGNQDGLALVCP